MPPWSRLAAPAILVVSVLHRNSQDVFNEYGVQIMTPNYVADTPEAKVAPKERWFEAPARPRGDAKPDTDDSGGPGSAGQPEPLGKVESALDQPDETDQAEQPQHGPQPDQRRHVQREGRA